MTIQTRAAALAAGAGLSGLAITGLAVLLALSLLNTYADVSLKGPLGIGFHFEGWKPKARRLQGTVDQFGRAQAEALRKAQAARARAEQSYRTLAERIDDEAEQARLGALDDAERFIATHRVRCAPDRGAGGGAAATATGDGAGGGQAMPGAAELDGAIAVPAADIRICTLNTLQAEAAREWAIGMEAATGAD